MPSWFHLADLWVPRTCRYHTDLHSTAGTAHQIRKWDTPLLSPPGTFRQSILKEKAPCEGVVTGQNSEFPPVFLPEKMSSLFPSQLCHFLAVWPSANTSPRVLGSSSVQLEGHSLPWLSTEHQDLVCSSSVTFSSLFRTLALSSFSKEAMQAGSHCHPCIIWEIQPAKCSQGHPFLLTENATAAPQGHILAKFYPQIHFLHNSASTGSPPFCAKPQKAIQTMVDIDLN